MIAIYHALKVWPRRCSNSTEVDVYQQEKGDKKSDNNMQEIRKDDSANTE